MDQSARHFQTLVGQEPTAAVDGVGRTTAGRDKCLVFVDDFDFDLAGQLAAKLEARSLRVTIRHRLSPLPTVTPSAKVTATPIFIGVKGDSGEGFAPSVLLGEKWKPATADVLRDRLTQRWARGV
ncbi:MAG: hypothetical protein U5J83_12715 [Bryobacterales bacterium]|nr:hypothetical protein [Bryobacterales bacterium]